MLIVVCVNGRVCQLSCVLIIVCVNRHARGVKVANGKPHDKSQVRAQRDFSPFLQRRGRGLEYRLVGQPSARLMRAAMMR